MKYPSFDGVGLEYMEEGDGDGRTVVLLHGFAADSRVNWDRAPLVPALLEAGRPVVRLDARGHGRSDKPHDPAAYGQDAMVADVRALLDQLRVEEVDLIGYSMGAITSLMAAAVEPRVRSAVLGGIGGRLLTHPLDRVAIAAALEADDAKSIDNPSARAFRTFADATGADRVALAAAQRAPWPTFDFLDDVEVPVLVVAGEKDDLAGSPDDLAAALPDGRAVTVPGDHLNAVVKPEFTAAVLDFLK
jgi:pimeloyl-ACP methyl ester carboxylesterase